jgi:hypothetical protein
VSAEIEVLIDDVRAQGIDPSSPYGIRLLVTVIENKLALIERQRRLEEETQDENQNPEWFPKG